MVTEPVCRQKSDVCIISDLHAPRLKSDFAHSIWTVHMCVRSPPQHNSAHISCRLSTLTGQLWTIVTGNLEKNDIAPTEVQIHSCQASEFRVRALIHSATEAATSKRI